MVICPTMTHPPQPILKSDPLDHLGPSREPSPVVAVRRIRPMAGGSQSQLCEGNDGHAYVVKSFRNPQGRRTLVNEWIANGLFKFCGVCVAPGVPVTLNTEVAAELLADRQACRYWEPGSESEPHYGSRLAVHPEGQAIYDFLPATMLSSVVNLNDFLGAMVLDCWMGNVDARQAVFFRGSTKRWVTQSGAHGKRLDMIAVMIDHGQCFQGATWSLKNVPTAGFYRAGAVYQEVAGLDDFAPWISKVAAISTGDVDALRWGLPGEWIDGDQNALDCLLEDLFRRRSKLPALLEEMQRLVPGAFPAWDYDGRSLVIPTSSKKRQG